MQTPRVTALLIIQTVGHKLEQWKTKKDNLEGNVYLTKPKRMIFSKYPWTYIKTDHCNELHTKFFLKKWNKFVYELFDTILCSKANLIVFLRYIKNASERHSNRTFINSLVQLLSCNNTHALTLIECEVNLPNSSIYVML